MTNGPQLSPLSNPLVTIEQLTNSSSRLDGIPADLEQSIRYAGTTLTQAAGILLRLPQEVIAQAIVSFTRFYMGPDGGSFRLHGAKVSFQAFMTCPQDVIPNMQHIPGHFCSLSLHDCENVLLSSIATVCAERLRLSSLSILSLSQLSIFLKTIIEAGS